MGKDINPSIQCKVEECKYHAQDREYCSLDNIVVGKQADYATTSNTTDCESFEVK